MVFSFDKTFRVLSALSVLFLAFFSPISAAEEAKSADASSKPIHVKGDTVEYFQQEEKAVGTGHVSIDYENVKLEADKITVYMATKKALAEGNVTLTQKGSVFKGQRAEYDFGTKVGHVDKMDAVIQPEYYARARKIEKVSDAQYRAVDSSVTTCCGDSPFYQIKAREIDIFPDDKIIIKNALLYIKDVPVLFIPYFMQPLVDFDRLPVQLFPGRTKEWGTFLLSKWRYNLVNRKDMSVKGSVLADYREKRGFAGGLETFYRGDDFGRGAVRLYYADDNEPPPTAESDRYRGQFRHQSKIGESTTLTTEINKLSDDQLVKDFFFHGEYEKSIVPENYVSIITAKPEYTLSVLERHRLDDFVSSVNRDPEVRFDTHNRQFAETPFYLRQEVQFTNLQREYANINDQLDVTRLDTNHTVSYAGRLGDVSFTPHVGTRQTFYSRDLDGGGNSHVRGAFDGGLDVNTRFYKTYDTTIHAWGLDYNKLRHIFVPTASYNYRPTPTIFYTRLQQFDEIDALDKQNFLRLNFENKLQTKHRADDGSFYTREIARIIPFMDYNFLNDRIDNVGLTTELRPYAWLGMQSDIVLDTHLGKVTVANFDVYYSKGPWKFAVGQRYLLDESSQTTAEVTLKLKDYEFKVYERFEFQENVSKEFEFTVSKYWDCVITDFTYNHREDGETFYVALRLKAFPSTPFSLRQSYNHPKAHPREIYGE